MLQVDDKVGRESRESDQREVDRPTRWQQGRRPRPLSPTCGAAPGRAFRVRSSAGQHGKASIRRWWNVVEARGFRKRDPGGASRVFQDEASLFFPGGDLDDL